MYADNQLLVHYSTNFQCYSQKIKNLKSIWPLLQWIPFKTHSFFLATCSEAKAQSLTQVFLFFPANFSFELRVPHNHHNNKPSYVLLFYVTMSHYNPSLHYFFFIFLFLFFYLLTFSKFLNSVFLLQTQILTT